MNELFLLVDSRGNFEKKRYYNAVEAKKNRASKAKDAYGPRGGGKMANPKHVSRALLIIVFSKAFFFLCCYIACRLVLVSTMTKEVKRSKSVSSIKRGFRGFSFFLVQNNF